MGVGDDVHKPVAYVFLMSIGGQSLEENKKHSGTCCVCVLLTFFHDIWANIEKNWIWN